MISLPIEHFYLQLISISAGDVFRKKKHVGRNSVFLSSGNWSTVPLLVSTGPFRPLSLSSSAKERKI